MKEIHMLTSTAWPRRQWKVTDELATALSEATRAIMRRELQEQEAQMQTMAALADGLPRMTAVHDWQHGFLWYELYDDDKESYAQEAAAGAD